MTDENQDQQIIQEFNAEGQLFESGVHITERSSIDSLSQRGYGTIENNKTKYRNCIKKISLGK